MLGQVINMCLAEYLGGSKYKMDISGLKEISVGYVKGGNMS